MKHRLLTILFLTAGYFGFGQCGTKVVLTSSQTQHLGTDSSIQRTDDEKTVIEFDKSTIAISPGDNHLTGKVDSITCNWTTPYKVGKTRLKVTITNDQGETFVLKAGPEFELLHVNRIGERTLASPALVEEPATLAAVSE